MEVAGRLPHSGVPKDIVTRSDIAPNDFFLFPKLKAVLKGRHFDTRDDIIEKSPLALKSIPKEAYKNCFDNWEKRWRWKIIVEILFLCQKTRVITENARSSQTEAVQAERRFYEGHGDRTEKGRTISRRLVANGLHSCRPLRRLPLTPPNRRQRLEWCRARSTWMTEWHRVVFSDESRFCLSSDSRRVRVWCRRGERSNPAAIVERPTVRQRGIMVWGAIAYDSRSPLLRIQGTMTAQRYVDDVLRPVTLPYLQVVPNALYQQDNARPHTARISQQALQDVQMLPWPPYSPDLSPIEHVWDIIGRRLHALPQPRSEDELWQMEDKLVLPVDAPAARTQAWTKPPSTSNAMPTVLQTPAVSPSQTAAPSHAAQTPPTAAVDQAPYPSKVSNDYQQEALTSIPIHKTSAQNILEPETSEDRIDAPKSRPSSQKSSRNVSPKPVAKALEQLESLLGRLPAPLFDEASLD
ncbi:hypothetical protein LAZ67_5002746 [Cordylochernes scorpioides]|uniref:Transposase n=1 Tax=Cordylochernes scorpioides TaxID=51811 RepID=A0ABY6KJL0_9ARAC|nr:hypothetical protein LAZ67_5002746 [Cordylochernes scorpioides]